MHVLVLGATGYVGRHIAARLVTDGREVTAVVRSKSRAAFLEEAGVRVVEHDLGDLDVMGRFLDQCDAVVWAAQLMLEDEDRLMRAYLERLAGSGKAFIFTSGTSLLSIPTNGDWSEISYAEEDVIAPRRQITPRLAIEDFVRASAQSGVRAIVVRPPMIWGNGGCRIISDLYHSARKTGAACYVGRGLNVYTNIHIDDLADLYSRALDSGVAGALYHAGSGEADFREMARAVADALGVSTRSINVEEAMEIWDRFMGKIVFPSCSRTRSPRARADLGWTPDPARCDILDECRNPVYAKEEERALPAWVRPSQ